MRAKQNTSAVQVGPVGCQFRTPGLEERCGLPKVTERKEGTPHPKVLSSAAT